MENIVLLAYFIFVPNLFIVNWAQLLEVKTQSVQKNVELCNKLGREPYFETDLVVGKPWRMYYTWNMKLDGKCIDMVFKNATPTIIKRIWSDMHNYMEQQPPWESAALLAVTGAAQHELLLFPAQGVAGCFLAVPNIIRDGDMAPSHNAVPLLKFQLKLVRNSQYLVMIDCYTGLGSLSARTERTPYRADIAAAAAKLDLGDGHPACIEEKNKEEQFFI